MDYNAYHLQFFITKKFCMVLCISAFLNSKISPEGSIFKTPMSNNDNTKIAVEATQEKYCKGDSY